MNYKKERVTTGRETRHVGDPFKRFREKFRNSGSASFLADGKREMTAEISVYKRVMPFTVSASFDARMAELADALDSKSCSERSVGSTPTPGTKSTQRTRGDDARTLSARKAS